MAYYSNELKKRAPASDLAYMAAGRLAIRNYEYQKAVDSLEQAVLRFPGSADAQSFYSQAMSIWSRALMISQRDEEAAQALEKASNAVDLAGQLDPFSLLVMQGKAGILAFQGDCSAIESLLEQALELDPEVGRIKMNLAICLHQNGGGIDNAMSIAETEPLGFARNTLMAIFLNELGDREAAELRMDQMKTAYGDSAAYQYGQIHSQWGETEKAFQWLQKAIEIHDPGIILSAGDPLLAPLHDDPRFEEILRAVGF